MYTERCTLEVGSTVCYDATSYGDKYMIKTRKKGPGKVGMHDMPYRHNNREIGEGRVRCTRKGMVGKKQGKGWMHVITSGETLCNLGQRRGLLTHSRLRRDGRPARSQLSASA